MPSSGAAVKQNLSHDPPPVNLALGMVLERDRAIVPDDIVVIGPELNRGVVPIRAQFDVGFVQRLAVDKDETILKGNSFSRQRDDALHEHDGSAGEADADDIAAPGFVAEI